ncbi:MAG: beta-ketoacyl synthase N-terminal-like domain-containing protein, partial [Enterobacter roggenkampii]
MNVGQDRVLARIKVPEGEGLDWQSYLLPPGLMDAALQAAAGLVLSEPSHAHRPLLPFMLESLEVIARCEKSMWVWVRRAASKGKEYRYDIDLINDEGEICVRLGGLLSRSLTQERTAVAGPVPVRAIPLPEPSASGSAGMGLSLNEKTTNYLKKRLAALLKYPLERLESDAPFEEYGINSIMIVGLTRELEKSFGVLPKTLFFEYQTLDALSDYFLDAHRETLLRLLAPDRPAPPQDLPQRPEKRAPYRVVAPSTPPPPAGCAIAIIGLAGRYPQSDSLDIFWEHLLAGHDLVTEVPPERWDCHRWFSGDKTATGTIYSRWGGFINHADRFDPLFFSISPREATFMDPQERLFLQCAWEAVEDAGYTREALARTTGGRVGVYAGVMYEEYQLYGAQRQAQGEGVALGGSVSSIANRVSYFFNFQGPSLGLDTMCSSSLTAIHLACESLRSGGCEVALAGGVNLSLHPNKYLLLSQGRFASTTGRCESFGSGGDGYVPGEGVGVVVLKPLAQAEADGDAIYGVLRGTAINHGGKTHGYTVPNLKAQADVIGRAFDEAGVELWRCGYLEAHGTGTQLGDPIEIAALSRVFAGEGLRCATGSVKSNIGHTESAAGIAGLTKVLLQMRHGYLVPSLHAETLNPNIDFESTPFRVQREVTAWPRIRREEGGVEREYPRLAGVSSFGAGGSNAHVVVEEYVSEGVKEDEVECRAMVVLSGRDSHSLRARAQGLLDWLEREGENASLGEIAYTLQVGREGMDERLGVVAETKEALR